jgi:3,4-dihydroxy-2-butanone 4-phosphate synthase
MECIGDAGGSRRPPLSHPFAPIQTAIETIRSGRMVVVVDDEDRENEGDLTLAAQHVTPEAIAFMATHGRGLICAALEGQRLDELKIPLMVHDNTSPFETAFCVSVEAREGTSTGISAHDRSRTIKALVDPASRPPRSRAGPVLRTGSRTVTPERAGRRRRLRLEALDDGGDARAQELPGTQQVTHEGVV